HRVGQQFGDRHHLCISRPTSRALMSSRVAAAVQLEETDSAAGAPSRRYFSRWRNPVLVAGVTLLGLMLCFVIVGPMISPYSPTEPAFDQPTFAGPSWSHPLGTDNFGRDTATRLAYGGRTDFVIAIVGTLLTVIVGLFIGLVAGFQGGKIDTLLMRVVDFTLALPYLVLVIGIIAVLGTAPTVIPGFGPLPVNVIFAIWLIGWVTYARLVRGE